MSYARFILIVLTSLCGVQAIAEEMAELLVTATRSEQGGLVVPGHITIIDRQMIQNSGGQQLADVLRGQGLQVRDLFGDGSRVDVDIRGFGEAAGANTLVLVDGRRLNNADTAAPALGSIALKDVERIEIVHGSSGVLFGDQSVGGVINIITRKAQGYRAEIAAQLGSYQGRGLDALLADRLVNGFAYSINTQTRRSNNYRAHNERTYHNTFMRLDYSYDASQVFFEYQMIDEDLQTPGALLQAEIQNDRRQSLPFFENDYADSEEKVARLGIEQVLNTNWSLLAELMGRDTDYRFVQNFRGCAPCVTAPDFSMREQNSFTPRLVGRYDLNAGAAVMTLGVDRDAYVFDIDSLFVNTRNERDVQSWYAHMLLPLHAQWTLKTGLRHAEMEDELRDLYAFPQGVMLKDDVQVAELGVVYQPYTDWRFFARYDENYRFPKVEEQTYTVIGVVGLETQRGKSREWGAEWQKENFSLLLSVTRLALEDEIAFDPGANGPFGPFGGANVNFAATLRETLLLQGDYRFSDDWLLRGSYTQVNAEFQSGAFNGNEVSGVADSIFLFQTEYRLTHQWQVFVEAQRLGEQYLLGDNANQLDKQAAYTVFNINMQWQTTPWRIALRVNNLTGRRHSEFANVFGAMQPSPERNFWLNLSYALE